MNITQFKKHLEKQGLSIQLDELKGYLKAEFELEDVPQNMVAELTNELKAKYATALEVAGKDPSEAIANIKQWFSEAGLTFSEERIRSKLQEFNLDPLALDQGYVQRWAAQIKGEALAPAGNSQPAPTQQQAIAAPQQPQQQPNLNIQPLTSAIHGTIEQMVTVHRQGELGAVDAMLNFYKGTQSRIVDGVNDGLSKIDMSSSLEAMLQQQRDALGDMNEAIADLINNVNVSAGVRDAA